MSLGDDQAMRRMKAQADALRLGIRCGIFSRGDAIRWADATIAEMACPPTEVVEVAVSTSCDRSAFDGLLDAIPGDADCGASKRILFAHLYKQLLLEPQSLRRVVRTLWNLSSTDLNFSPEERSMALFLDDEYDLAASRAWGSLDQVRREALDLLGPYGGDTLFDSHSVDG
jgi:hypothetical protein